MSGLTTRHPDWFSTLVRLTDIRQCAVSASRITTQDFQHMEQQTMPEAHSEPRVLLIARVDRQARNDAQDIADKEYEGNISMVFRKALDLYLSRHERKKENPQ